EGTGRFRVTVCWPPPREPMLADALLPPEAPGRIFSSAPIERRSALGSRLAMTMSLGSTPNRFAMLYTVSPGATTYVDGVCWRSVAGGGGGSGLAPGRINSVPTVR